MCFRDREVHTGHTGEPQVGWYRTVNAPRHDSPQCDRGGFYCGRADVHTVKVHTFRYTQEVAVFKTKDGDYPISSEI